MYTDSVGNQLAVGDIILVSRENNHEPAIAVITEFTQFGIYKYINIKYIVGTRNWKSKANGRFPHPHVAWKPKRKPGEYVFGVESKEDRVYPTRFMIKITDNFSLPAFCKKHMSWHFSQLDQTHKTMQTKQDFVDMVNAELIKLKTNEQPKQE